MLAQLPGHMRVAGTDDVTEKFLLYPDSETGSTPRAENTRKTLERLFEEGRGQDIPGVQGTSWAALNAVTEFVDHHRSTRGPSERARADRWLRSRWFGSGARLKAHAWELALLRFKAAWTA